MSKNKYQKFLDRIEKELDYMSYPLHIGILSNNLEDSEIVMKELITNEKLTIIELSKNKVLMSDGTIYYPISNCDNIRSRKLDQLIVRKYANIKYEDLLNSVLLYYSCVPKEFQVQFYD